ncbi:MAG: hypothetical protein IT352_15425 [Gemmatimonadales bacterium]|nr:hypothetical protein [Gemmatimonadales bacterium]
MTIRTTARTPGLGFGASWAMLGIVLVLLAQVGPSGNRLVRMTLVVILVYLVLTHTEQVSRLVDQLLTGLTGGA